MIDLAHFSGIETSELWSVSYVTHSIQDHFVRIDISIVIFLMLFLCYFIQHIVSIWTMVQYMCGGTCFPTIVWIMIYHHWGHIDDIQGEFCLISCLFQYEKHIFSGMGIPIIKIRLLCHHRIFIMEIPILIKHFYIETVPQQMVALTHLPLVPYICISELGQHWLR